MSGGSFDYLCYKMEEAVDRIDAQGHTKYEELLKELLVAMAKIMKEIEWWYSGDCSEAHFIGESISQNEQIKVISEKWTEETKALISVAIELKLKERVKK